MCGILGCLGSNPNPKKFEQARDILAHRGPDDFGVYFNNPKRVALGHRRLSIIDLSADGRQPMQTRDGRFVIVFNGEIYNYVELKEQLNDNYSFRTRTDTEVLLASYIKWGEKCLQKLNGMFAFAIYDSKKDTLFCARDRLGIKPFYYFPGKETFMFASEIKSLLALGIRAEVNQKIIYDYLARGYYDHTSETFFKNIYQLQAGYFAIYELGKLKVKNYWDLANIDTNNVYKYAGQTSEQLEDKLRELMADSIRLQFRSDVPVGINLSSGLDSMSLLYFAEKVTQKRLHLFSSCLPDSEYDECQYIKNFLNNEQKEKWHTTYLKPKEVFPRIEQMLEIQDEPYGGLSTIMYSVLYKSTRQAGVKVLLEGQGGDELLAGYPYYKVERAKDDLSQDLTRQIYPEVLNDDFLDTYKDKKEYIFPRPFGSCLLNAQYRDLKYTKLPRTLRFNDRISMAHGRELRVPYLDHRIVEYCFFLPKNYKLSSESSKKLLRDAMAPFIPRVVRYRPKVVFGAVQPHWFRKYFEKEILDILCSQTFKNRPYWDHKKIMEKTKSFFAGEGENSFFIWQWIILEMWLKKYTDSVKMKNL